jgi:HemY protein
MRFFIFFILILVAAVLAGISIAGDPGYVLFLRGPWSVEMPLWVALVLFILLFLVFYVIVRVLGGLFSSAGIVQQWVGQRRRHRAHRHMCRGLVEFTEGHWKSAEHYLVSSAANSDTPLIHYLASAHAAQRLGKVDQRDRYLRLAYQCAPHAKIAIGLTQAHLQLESKQFEQAVATLSHLRTLSPNHAYILKKLKQVAVILKDWDRLFELLPALKKYKTIDALEAEQLEVQYYRQQFTTNDLTSSLAILQKQWKELPRRMRKNTILVADYAKALLQNKLDAEADILLQEALKKGSEKEPSNDSLVMLYNCVNANKEKQFQFIENLAHKQEHSASLLYVAGCFAMKNKLYEKAENYLTLSLRLDSNQKVMLTFAKLYELTNRSEDALRLYRDFFAE